MGTIPWCSPEHDVAKGDLVDAMLRSVNYIARAGSGADERALTTMKSISARMPARMRIGQQRFKAALRKQFLTLRLDEDRAMEALPALLPDDPKARSVALDVISEMFASRERTDAEIARLKYVEELFAQKADPGDRDFGHLKVVAGKA
jgi:hypothetical protein